MDSWMIHLKGKGFRELEMEIITCALFSVICVSFGTYTREIRWRRQRIEGTCATLNIRRAVLDGFWGRASGTVNGNLGQLRGFHKIVCEEFGLMEALPEFPLMDTFGIGSALVMLRRSLMPGKYGDNIQYDTLRKYRSAFSNVWGASVHDKYREMHRR